jgi:hypothetical protein
MTTRVSVVVAGLVVVVAGACKDPLTAKNFNTPDVIRVFQQPAAIEQTLGSGYQQCRNTEKGNDLTAQLANMSGESYSALNNFNMGPRDGIPRAPILNNKTSSQSLGGTFSAWSRQGRLQANALKQLDALHEANGIALATAAGDLRARAMGFFNIGCNLGWLSLTFDSAGIIDHLMPSDSVPPLSGYDQVNVAALAFLDSAIAMANTAGSDGSGGFPTAASWFGGVSLGKAEFIKLARSLKARFRADVARNKAERAAVNWAAVAADAEAGISADFIVAIGGTTGWSIGLQSSQFHVEAAWAQLTMMYNGFTDTGNGYSNWLATPILTRNGDFAVVTPDKRWPQGATLAAQRLASPEPKNHTDFPYIQARGNWSPADPWGESWYSHHRYKYIRNNSQQGPYPDFLKAEVDLLAAEAYLRLGDMSKALAKINISRTKAGLPALAGATSMNDLVPNPPGGTCIPRVPTGPSFTTVACGSIFEAYKYEWRMELAYNRAGAWFFPMRGWEDLVINTPLYYPVPVDELDARLLPYYNIGGGGPGSAPSGTYKF